MRAADFVEILKKFDFDSFFGVPDSLLKSFCKNIENKNNIIAANEGNAVALGCGYYLAKGRVPVIYMQNSGLGNCINPVLSLADIYEIPLLFIVGWRGEPSVKDEPQHYRQGKLTRKMLDCIEIENEILSCDIKTAQKQILKAKEYIAKTGKSYAFIIKKGTFENESTQFRIKFQDIEITRKEAVEEILKFAPENSFFVSTTGYISRELYRNSKDSARNFLTVGSMGHASSIALSVALEKKDKTIFCLDGDGALLMHLGAIGIIAQKSPKNFKHILLNNFVHDSVGAQPTSSNVMNFSKIFEGAGYKKIYSVDTLDKLREILPIFIQNDKLSFLEIKIKPEDGAGLPRPINTPSENKIAFMEKLNEC